MTSHPCDSERSEESLVNNAARRQKLYPPTCKPGLADAAEDAGGAPPRPVWPRRPALL